MSLTRHRRWVTTAAVAATAALALSACSTGASGDADSDGKTVVSISSWYQDKEFKPALDAANKVLAKDGIELEYSYIALDQYNNWLSVQLASGSGPDLFMDGASFPARVKAGNAVDVTDRESIADFNDAGLALAKDQDGKVFGIPTYGWFSGYFYNADLFAENDVEPPQTFDELLEVSKTFQDAGIKPLAFGLSGSDKGLHSLMGYLENAYYHNGEGSPEVDTEFAFDKATLSGNWNDSVDEWSKLIDQGVITPDMLGIAEPQAQDEFLAGKAAMIISGPWDYTKFTEAGLNIGMFAHPGNSADDQYMIGGPAANIGVNKGTSKMDAAMKAFDAFASEEVQQAFLDGNPGAFSYSGATAPMPEEYALVEDTLAKGNVGNAWDRWGANMPAQSMVDEVTKQLEGLIGGQLTTDQFVKALDSFADTIRY
ncbi:ABC transporter substrate-binding protein [Microbacterium sp. USHLN186]|uniref:ABC transporter substrate-binding protein n=1 Tax=Microbacterium sp. USHLN186 TaxID=3081286 RepID=UPI00301640DA